MSIKSKFFVMFLAYVGFVDMCFAQGPLKIVNRASSQNLCLQVSPSGTAADAVCIAGSTRVVTIGVNASTFPGNIIYGVQNGTAQTAGQVGEYITSTVTTAAVSPVAGQFTNITSISLTPGAWLLSGGCDMERTSGQGEFHCAISDNSNNTVTDHTAGKNYFFITNSTQNHVGLSVQGYIVETSTSKSQFLKFKYDAGTQSSSNIKGTITALRIR
jgi:hypothetical protein